MTSDLDLRSFIRDIPDFPKPGIVFKDITPLLLDARAYDHAVTALAEYARPLDVDVVLAAEARGFIFGAPLALRLGAGFVPIRKPGRSVRDHPRQVHTCGGIAEQRAMANAGSEHSGHANQR